MLMNESFTFLNFDWIVFFNLKLIKANFTIPIACMSSCATVPSRTHADLSNESVWAPEFCLPILIEIRAFFIFYVYRRNLKFTWEKQPFSLLIWSQVDSLVWGTNLMQYLPLSLFFVESSINFMPDFIVFTSASPVFDNIMCKKNGFFILTILIYYSFCQSHRARRRLAISYQIEHLWLCPFKELFKYLLNSSTYLKKSYHNHVIF